jgi:hypothetical protein
VRWWEPFSNPIIETGFGRQVLKVLEPVRLTQRIFSSNINPSADDQAVIYATAQIAQSD